MTKSNWEKIFSILLAAILAILAVSGWVIVPTIMEQPEARLRERISIDARDDAYLYNGADLYFYSDGHATQVAHIDGATGNITGEGTFQYGADDLYPVGFASSGQQAVYGTSTITGTEVAAHGLTTVTFALCTLGEVAETGAGDAAAVSLAISSNVVTLATWQDDFTAATETDVVVHWLVIGAP